MADTWVTAQAELQALLDDAVFNTSGSKEAYLLTWANRVIKDIALEIPIRQLFADATITTATSTFEYPFATYVADFLKISDRFTKVRVDDSYPTVVTLEELNDYDPDHDETSTNEDPTVIAIEGNSLWTYPAMGSATTFILENYIREPIDMTATSSTPDLPWVYYVTDLLVAGVAGRYGFPWLNEFDQAKFWASRYGELVEKYRFHLDKSNSTKRAEPEFY